MPEMPSDDAGGNTPDENGALASDWSDDRAAYGWTGLGAPAIYSQGWRRGRDHQRRADDETITRLTKEARELRSNLKARIETDQLGGLIAAGGWSTPTDTVYPVLDMTTPKPRADQVTVLLDELESIIAERERLDEWEREVSTNLGREMLARRKLSEQASAKIAESLSSQQPITFADGTIITNTHEEEPDHG